MNDKEYIEFLEGKEKTQTETVNFLIKENEKLNNALNGKITAYKCREVDKLQSNWNSLREIIKDCYKRYEDSNIELNDTYKYYLKSPLPPRYTMNLGAIELIDYILDKMNELEGEDK